jgi:hypothetical protein
MFFGRSRQRGSLLDGELLTPFYSHVAGVNLTRRAGTPTGPPEALNSPRYCQPDRGETATHESTRDRMDSFASKIGTSLCGRIKTPVPFSVFQDKINNDRDDTNRVKM